MRTLGVLVVIFLSAFLHAEEFRVSQLKYDNFKTYDEYDISVEDIRAVLTSFSKENPRFDKSGLYRLAARLADLYRNKGLVFHRVEVVVGNPTRLVLIPGVLTAIDVRGNQRYSTEQLSGYFDDMFGRLVDSKSMADAMTQMNSLPGLQGLSFLSFGQRPGDAVLNVNINQESWGGVSTRLNNFGTEATGNYRLTSQLTLNNPLKLREQWRVGGSVSDSYENWAANFGVDFYTRSALRWGLSGQFQNTALDEDFDLLDMSGWQASGDVYATLRPIQKPNVSLAMTAKTGYLHQSLDNAANISFFDIEVQDVPIELSLQGDFAGNKTFLGYQLKTKAGYLLTHDSPVTLEEDYWALISPELSIAQSLSGGVLQRGIDVTTKLQGQYALTPLPSHRRFGLTGSSKVGSQPNGFATADTAAFSETSLRLLNISLGPVQTVVEGIGQVGWGELAQLDDDWLFGVGGQLQILLGPLNTEVSAMTDENFEDWRVWFELTLDWPKGR